MVYVHGSRTQNFTMGGDLVTYGMMFRTVSGLQNKTKIKPVERFDNFTSPLVNVCTAPIFPKCPMDITMFVQALLFMVFFHVFSLYAMCATLYWTNEFTKVVLSKTGANGKPLAALSHIFVRFRNLHVCFHEGVRLFSLILNSAITNVPGTGISSCCLRG